MADALRDMIPVIEKEEQVGQTGTWMSCRQKLTEVASPAGQEASGCCCGNGSHGGMAKYANETTNTKGRLRLRRDE